MAGLNSRALIGAVTDHALTSGHFDRVAGHEPKSAPGHGLTVAVWVDRIEPLGEASGLASTSALLRLSLRIYASMLTEPQDAIDPNMVDAVDALMTAYAADFTLGGLVRNVDLLGEFGEGLNAQAGYIEQDSKLLRVYTLNVPLVINDAFPQVA